MAATSVKRDREAAAGLQHVPGDEDTRAKRRHVDDSKECLVYIIPNKLSSGHVKHLKSVAVKKKISLAIEDKYGMH